MRRIVPPALLCGVLLTFAAAAPAPAAPPVFTHGVSSGDVTSRTAVLWTRVDQSVVLEAEVSTNATFAGPEAFDANVSATAGNDFTAKVIAFGLAPNTSYFYRWRKGSTVSPVGKFKTAPSSSSAANVKFAYTGDSDGTLVGGNPFFNNFEVLDAVRAENPDFFGYIGDTIYSDSSLRPGGLPATTLSEYRDAYKVNRGYAALTDLLKATSTYVQADDHEVQNDYDGTTVDPARYAAGREAFVEYFPILTIETPFPGCAGTPMFRAFHWGSKVDLFIPDERSCRSADVAVQCAGDLAPTLPAFLRPSFGLPASPPAGCLTALNDPSRTMLGSAQKALFKFALKHSTAKFKIVLSELAIQQFYALPYDRWEGYAAERAEILNFIRSNSISNVVFLTTDNHANLTNEVFIDRFADPTPIAYEAITGPIATFTLQQEIVGGFGAPALVAFNAVIGPLPFGPNGVDCRELNTASYGLVDVNASAGTATITLKDDTGTTINDAAGGGPCVKTLGP